MERAIWLLMKRWWARRGRLSETACDPFRRLAWVGRIEKGLAQPRLLAEPASKRAAAPPMDGQGMAAEADRVAAPFGSGSRGTCVFEGGEAFLGASARLRRISLRRRSRSCASEQPDVAYQAANQSRPGVIIRGGRSGRGQKAYVKPFAAPTCRSK